VRETLPTVLHTNSGMDGVFMLKILYSSHYGAIVTKTDPFRLHSWTPQPLAVVLLSTAFWCGGGSIWRGGSGTRKKCC